MQPESEDHKNRTLDRVFHSSNEDVTPLEDRVTRHQYLTSETTKLCIETTPGIRGSATNSASIYVGAASYSYTDCKVIWLSYRTQSKVL
jgi:hypothetical protein